MDESCEYIFGNINSINSSISNNIFGGLLNQTGNLLTAVMVFFTFFFIIAINSYQQRIRSRINLHEKIPANEIKNDQEEF